MRRVSQERTAMDKVLATIVACLIVGLCGLRLDAQTPTLLTATGAPLTTVTTPSAPVYLLPDASRQPLIVAARDSRLRVLGRTEGWVNVEFQDPQLGRRVGYIESKHIGA